MSEKHTCCHKYYPSAKNFYPSPCGKNAKFEREGKHYCGIHDPVTLEEKRKARMDATNARYAAEAAARNAKVYKQAEVELNAARYEYVRTLNAIQFQDIFTAVFNRNGTFDELIDIARQK